MICGMEKSALEPLIDQGLGLRPIANLLNTSVTNVRYWIRKHGLELKQKPFGSGYTPLLSPHKCGRCGETDPARFYGNKRKVCEQCHNAYNIKQGQNKRLRAVNELGGRCVVCGFGRHSCSLDIHHKNPRTKDPKFRSMRGWSWEHISTELKNCILVCKNCHAAIHAGLLQI